MLPVLMLQTRKRNRELSSQADGTPSGDSAAMEAPAKTLIETLRQECHSLVEPDAVRPWYKHIPFIVAPFISKRRLVQFLLYAGSGLKSGLIEELSQHILIDALLLTVTCTPITLTPALDGPWEAVVYAMFFLTAVLQISSLTSCVIWICAFVQIESR